MFTEEILKQIAFLKGRVKTYLNLTRIINKNFKTDFEVTQVKYQVTKIMNQTYGRAEEDAYKFVKLAEEKSKNGGYFNCYVINSSTFNRAIYLSDIMLTYAQYFLDIVIIDSTYKRNHFNLPIVDVIGINNYGQNFMLAFGLLSEETSEAYKWFFAELKKAWKNKKPLNFIIDGCLSMKQGKLIFDKIMKDF